MNHFQWGDDIDSIITKLESIKNKEMDLNDIKLMTGYELDEEIPLVDD